MDLEAWSRKVDPGLPTECPKCKKTLDQIRYSTNKDITSIHLTGAVNKYYYYMAECPYCDHALLRQGAGEEHIR